MSRTNEIIARLRLKGIARFAVDAKIAERSLEGIKNAADSDALNNFGGALSQLQDILPKGSTETGILGLTLSSLIFVVVAATPLVIALGGAVVALAGSMGAAALGAGALGVAAVGAAVPLGILALVAMDAFKGFQQVNTAFAAWQKSVSMYGRNSTQAETALARLNAVAKQFGGPILIRAVQAWNNFMGAFRNANRGTIHAMYGILLSLIAAGEKLLPTFSKVASIVSGALADGFKTVVNEITSSGFQQILINLADTFARLSGPLIRSVMNFLMGLFSIANRLAPVLTWVASGIERASMAFRSWAESGSLGGIIAQFQSWWGLIKAVGGLLVTILSAGASQGKGLVDSLTAVVNKWNEWLSTTAGQKSLHNFFKDAVDLTRVLFRVLAGITAVWFKFGRALMPVYTTVFHALIKGWHMLMDAMKPIKPFWDNVLGPLLGGVVKGVILGVVGAFKLLVFAIRVISTVLGFLGKILAPFAGVFKVIGEVLGFIFGGAILKVLAGLGKLSVLLRPLGFIFKMLELPIKAAGAMVGWFGSKIAGVAEWLYLKASYIFTPLYDAINAAINWLTGAGSKIYNTFVWIFNRVKGAIGSILGQVGNLFHPIVSVIKWVVDRIKWVLDKAGSLQKKLGKFGDFLIPGGGHGLFSDQGILGIGGVPFLAGGGVVSGSGTWVSGEAGPEISTLRNGRVTVVPLSPSVNAQGTSATVMPNDGPARVLVSKVYLKNKQIAEAVADERDDERARK